MKAAIVGIGAMGQRHARALARVEGVRLVAVCDVRPEALEWDGIGRDVDRYQQFRDLLGRSAPDLLIVATTAPSHFEAVMQALDAGVGRILCEKPFATSLRRAGDMIDAARARGALLAVNHGRRHAAAYRWLSERIRSGEWGNLQSMRFACPGVGLGCLGTHFIDLMRFLSGEEFSSVSGWIDREHGMNPRGCEFHDPGGLWVARSASGAYFVHHQMEEGAGPTHLSIDLTQARILIEENEGRITVIWRDPSVKTGPGRPPRYVNLSTPSDAVLTLDVVALAADVIRDLVRGGPLACDAREGYRSLEAVVAAYRSHEKGHLPVDLPISDTDALDTDLPIT